MTTHDTDNTETGDNTESPDSTGKQLAVAFKIPQEWEERVAEELRSVIFQVRKGPGLIPEARRALMIQTISDLERMTGEMEIKLAAYEEEQAALGGLSEQEQEGARPALDQPVIVSVQQENSGEISVDWSDGQAEVLTPDQFRTLRSEGRVQLKKP